MPGLLIAAGGGGDAITASVLGHVLGLDERPVVMTYSWDRLMIDPLPGPRGAADFTGLGPLAQDVLQVLATTSPRPPAGSSLPRLAAVLPARLVLLDPVAGTAGLATQILAAADHLGSTDVTVVDVGGDVLTDGSDAGLRSPLADQLVLAACAATGLPARLVVAAAGIDGEVPAAIVLERLRAAGAERLPDLIAEDLSAVRDVFSWHPSEASGLLAAATLGLRGRVEVRDAGDHVDLTEETVRLHRVDIATVLPTVPAAHLLGASSLDEASRVMEEVTGMSEIRYETAKAQRLIGRSAHVPQVDDLVRIDDHARRARDAGADFISIRRLAELLGATTAPAFTALGALLARARPAQYCTSVLRTS